MRPDVGAIFEAHVKTGGQGVDRALRRFALHFKIDINISLLMGADGTPMPLEEYVGDLLSEEAAPNVLAKHSWSVELLGGETRAAIST